ncbi:hypothetical protein GJ744_001710 [Endocarpon pusillum]|uniref:Uncharacterized protein n=1 Tax=Endocarpon pusillum TaxID=364733 RepID=A0A8H7E0E3_9EURO|nr:hypothetical protein GJ744_001710 [Endocarpon pusillum]
MDYWLHSVHKNAEAQQLASRLQLEFPHGEMRGCKSGMMYPMRRLVIAGEDNPANFALLFGPNWERNEQIREIQERARITLLLAPPTASPAGMSAACLDEGYTGPWRPRPPTREEEAKIQQVRDVARVMGI